MKKLLFTAISVFMLGTLHSNAAGSYAYPVSESAENTINSADSTVPNRAEWMGKSRWGIMVHYLADWRARTDHVTITPAAWNHLVEGVDVAKLARQVDSAGAGYLIFTIGQNSGYFDAPNKVYERLTGIKNKCSHRDLISDLSNALKKYGIKLIVYLPAGAPAGDARADSALNWENGPHRGKEFQIKWEQIIREWSLQWGRQVAGWWFDGCYWPNTMYRSETTPNFKSFANAARAGNPQSCVAFNPGVVYRTISISPYEDYTAGEIDHPERMSIKRVYHGKVDGSQLHILSYLGTKWGMGSPRFTVQQIIEWGNQVIKAGGAITWDTPVQRDGTFSPAFMAQLTSFGNDVKAIEKVAQKNDN